MDDKKQPVATISGSEKPNIWQFFEVHFINIFWQDKKRKKISLIVLTLMLVVVMFVTAILINNHQINTGVKLSPSDLAASGQYAQAQQQLDKQATSGSPQQRAYVFIQKSAIALNAQKYNDALNFAQQAEALTPTSTTAQLIAVSQQGLGNKQQAISYYQKAISRFKNPSEQDQADIRSYQDAIKSLGG